MPRYNPPINIETGLIWKGLMSCDRETLCIFVSLFENARGLALFSDKAHDIKNSVQNKYREKFLAEAQAHGEVSAKDFFSQRISKTSDMIMSTDLPDDALRTALWDYILATFKLTEDGYLSKNTIRIQCDDISNKVAKVAFKQYQKEKLGLSRHNPFTKSREKLFQFEEALDYQISKITKEAVSQDSEILSNIEKEISNLDSKVIEESGVLGLTSTSINKALLTSGSLLGLMGGVQAAGFSAYILAAQASALIPLIGGKTLVSLLFVVTSPLFVLPAIVATGAASNNSLQKSVKEGFAAIITTMLVMRGLTKAEQLLETETFLINYNQNIELLARAKNLRASKNYQSKFKLPVANLPRLPKLSNSDKKLLSSRVEAEKSSKGYILKIYPTSLINADNAAISSITLADFLYDVGAIDPRVIEATDFSRASDISNVFEFSLFAEELKGLSEASLDGHHANIMGYTAERIVASELIRQGHVIEIPESSSQPGYDLLVDGHEFQVKCLLPENFHILQKHFTKYPDTPVFVNSEMFETITDRSTKWANLVFYVEGYTHETASGLTENAIEAGQALDDYEIFSSIALASVVKNMIHLSKGEQSIHEATFNIALDSVSRGTMAMASGFAGSGIGMLVFGPAGAYVLGGISTMFGATQGSIITNKIDRFLDPERDSKLITEANNLLFTCNEELTNKITLIKNKIAALSEIGIPGYVRYRLAWEILSCKVMIKRHEELISDISMSGTKKIFRALRLASESTVHPYCLQENYMTISSLLSKKVDRVGNAKDIWQEFWSKKVRP